MPHRQILTRPRLAALTRVPLDESSADDSDRENPGQDEPSSPDESISTTPRSSNSPGLVSKGNTSSSSYIKYWSPEEDDALIDAVNKHGGSNWAAIEDEMAEFGRTKSQCSLRWSYNLDPKVNRGPFTPDEDKALLAAQKSIGNKWKQISEHLRTHRHPIALRHRWVYLVNGGSSSDYSSSGSNSSSQPRSPRVASVEKMSPTPSCLDDSDDIQTDSMDPQCGKSTRNGSKKRKSSQDEEDSLATDAVELLGSFASSPKRSKVVDIESAINPKEEEAERILDDLFGSADQVELLAHIMKNYLDVKIALKSQAASYEAKIAEMQNIFHSMAMERQMLLEERVAMTQALASMHQQRHVALPFHVMPQHSCLLQSAQQQPAAPNMPPPYQHALFQQQQALTMNNFATAN